MTPERHRMYVRDDVLYMLPDPGQFQDERLQLAVSLRNEATLNQRCPVCAATSRLPNRAERRRLRGKVIKPVMEHEHECPCSDERLAELILETGEVLA